MKEETKKGTEKAILQQWNAGTAKLCGNIELSVCHSVHLSRGLDQVQLFIYLPML